MFKIIKNFFRKPCSGCSSCRPFDPQFLPKSKTKHSRFFQQGWLRLCAKSYAGKSKKDFGKLYDRLHKASTNYKLEEKLFYYCGPCLPEVHSRANIEFGLNIYL